MKSTFGALVVAAALLLSACDRPLAPTEITGLTGVVSRGPVTPVCRADIVCDAPFSAGFSVTQAARHVADFRSDANGRFTVSLPPGTYRITPHADAPLMAPEIQAKTVEVAQAGLTYVTLQFDTGIR